MRHWAYTHVQKRRHFRQGQLNDTRIGDGDYGAQTHIAKPYSCLTILDNSRGLPRYMVVGVCTDCKSLSLCHESS